MKNQLLNWRSILFIGVLVAAILVAWLNQKRYVLLCGRKIKICSDCKRISDHGFSGPGFTVWWQHLKSPSLTYLVEEKHSMLLKKANTLDTLKGKIFDDSVTIVKYRLKENEKQKIHVLVFGLVNEHHLLLSLAFDQDANHTPTIPDFTRQFLTIEQ
jgi:hypothetical protein